MTEPSKSTSRAPLVAMIAAGLSLVVAVIAVVVVVNRSGGSGGGGAAAGPVVEDGDITAADVVKLATASDAGASAALGLAAGDTLVAIDGVPVKGDSDRGAAVTQLALAGAARTLYVEIDRKGTAVLLRRRITGDLNDAWADAHPAPRPAVAVPTPVDPIHIDPPVASTQPSDPVVDDEITAMLDTIKTIDDTHTKIPRAVVDKILANPMAVAKGARVVPAIKNGEPIGIKLYAIRPSSIYSKIGLKNGDMIKRINGYDLDSADKALEVYTKLKDASHVVLELERRGAPVTLNLTIK